MDKQSLYEEILEDFEPKTSEDIRTTGNYTFRVDVREIHYTGEEPITMVDFHADMTKIFTLREFMDLPVPTMRGLGNIHMINNWKVVYDNL